VPTDFSPGRIFRDERVRKIVSGYSGKGSRAGPHFQKELGNWKGGLKAGIFEVITPAEVDDPPLCQKLLKFEFGERKLFYLPYEVCFLVSLDKIRPVSKATGAWPISKKFPLYVRGFSHRFGCVESPDARITCDALTARITADDRQHFACNIA
jgi:hypothetical protein